MSTLRVIAVLAFVLISSSVAKGQDFWSYHMELCNTGDLTLSVAWVEKIPATFGWDWSVEGWFNIKPKECDVVWKDKVYEGGWSHKAPALYVAFSFRDASGAWGPVTFENPKFTKSDFKFCGSQEAFSYNRQPTTNCTGSQVLLPASFYFDPAPGFYASTRVVPGIYEPPGGYVTPQGPLMNLALWAAKDRVDHPVSVGAPPARSNNPGASAPDSSSGSSIGTALGAIAAVAVVAAGAAILSNATAPKPFEAGTLNAMMLDRKVVRRINGNDNWYFEDGSQGDSDIFDFLKGVTKSNLFDARFQRSNNDPQVVAAEETLQRAFGSWARFRDTHVSSAGRFFYRWVDIDNNVIEDSVTLGTLDFSQAKAFVAKDGHYLLEIPCYPDNANSTVGGCVIGVKQDTTGKTENYILPSLILNYKGDNNGDAVAKTVVKLRQLYPAAPNVVTR